MLSITKMHKPQIHQELTDILKKYNSSRSQANPTNSNIMDEVMKCVRKDPYLARIYKSFFDQDNQEAAEEELRERSAVRPKKVKPAAPKPPVQTYP